MGGDPSRRPAPRASRIDSEAALPGPMASAARGHGGGRSESQPSVRPLAILRARSGASPMPPPPSVRSARPAAPERLRLGPMRTTRMDLEFTAIQPHHALGVGPEHLARTLASGAAARHQQVRVGKPVVGAAKARVAADDRRRRRRARVGAARALPDRRSARLRVVSESSPPAAAGSPAVSQFAPIMPPRCDGPGNGSGWRRPRGPPCAASVTVRARWLAWRVRTCSEASRPGPALSESRRRGGALLRTGDPALAPRTCPPRAHRGSRGALGRGRRDPRRHSLPGLPPSSFPWPRRHSRSCTPHGLRGTTAAA